MIKLSLRRHQGRVDQLIDLEVDVSLYCLRSVRHEPALASELVAELRDVRLKQVYPWLKFSAHGCDHMIHAARVVGGVADSSHWIFLSIFVSVAVFADERVQELTRHAVDRCTSGSRMGSLADPNAEETIEPIVLVNT